MKKNILFLTLCALVLMSSCAKFDEMEPEGNGLTENQYKESIATVPARSNATFNSLFTMMSEPCAVFPSSSRPDDFGYVMIAFSNDLEGPDCWMPNSGYNWFSVCGEYTSRNANYANPYIRYMTPYMQIRVANEVIGMYDVETASQEGIYQLAQARACRAFAYEQLAPSFQFLSNKDGLCVPLVLETTLDPANNPRATVAEVYKQILEDLDFAVKYLEGFDRGSDKSRINQQVAYGLRARANLAMGNWSDAQADAEKAMAGYRAYTIDEVSTPAFCNIADASWIWGADVTQEQAAKMAYATSSAWIGSFSSDSYSAACACYAGINNLLYNKIPDTDIRKQWWIHQENGSLYSSLLNGLTWGDAKGQEIVNLYIKDVKEPYTEFTNVKFGLISGVASDKNDSDWPLMRYEEMKLIQLEAKARQNQDVTSELQSFIRQTRDPQYIVSAKGLSILDEIWFQRRVELWGEGFSIYDANRLDKPIVRFHEGETTCYPDAFQINLGKDNGWRLMRFPQSELDTNFGIVDNKDGDQPVQGNEGSLKDCVTD